MYRSPKSPMLVRNHLVLSVDNDEQVDANLAQRMRNVEQMTTCRPHDLVE